MQWAALVSVHHLDICWLQNINIIPQLTWSPVARQFMPIYFYFLPCTLPIWLLLDRLSVSHSHIHPTVCFRHQNYSTVVQLVWPLQAVRWAVGCSNREKHCGALRLFSPWELFVYSVFVFKCGGTILLELNGASVMLASSEVGDAIGISVILK